MISLLLNTLRLLAIVAALIWIPGWLACRRPLRPLTLLQPAILGTGIHVAALVLTSYLAGTLTRAAWILPIVTYGIALAIRLLVRRRIGQIDAPPALPPRLGALVTGLVLLAAILRALHNFHYDDLQHLYYITELDRVNFLFPFGFLLDLAHGTVPFFGSGSVMLSRYPYWAVSYALMGRLAGVPAGDVYLLLGLGVLGLVLAQMAASLAAAWSSSIAAFLVLLVIASGPYVSDSLLNYGGYPFQSGKLFIIMAATAIICAWRTRRGRDLVPAAIGLFVGPLLHTNNAIGMMVVLGFAIPLVGLRTLRRPAMAVIGSAALLGMTATGGVVTSGFVRWVPDESKPPMLQMADNAAPGVPTATATEMPAPQTADPPKRDSVSRRLALFVWRGTPLEVLVLALGAIAAALAARLSPRADRAWIAASAGAAMVIVAAVGVDVARQVVTSALKPGYLRMRSGLIAMKPAIDPQRPVFTDPITDVLARAAGWPLTAPPALGIRQQSLLVLLLHPAITGPALDNVLASIGPATIVVNEQIVGAGVAAKFRGVAGLRETAHLGDEPPALAEAGDSAVGLMNAVYRLEFNDLSEHAAEAGRALAALVWSRPITAFIQDRETQPFQPGQLGHLLRGTVDGQAVSVERFLNSAIVTLPRNSACADGVNVTLRNVSSFDSSLLVWPLDAFAPALSRGTEFATLGATGSTATLPIEFGGSVCGVPPVSLLIHATYWWDFRFAVDSVEWRYSRAAE